VDLWAILPCKRLGEAKARLADVLAPAERRALAGAMFKDVLAALKGAHGLVGIAVVSDDPEARARAEEIGAVVLSDPPQSGQSAAVQLAAEALAELGASGVLALAADTPMITAGEIEQVLAVHGVRPGITLVPDRHGLGTNAIACTPPRALPFGYGKDSCRRHLDAARARGLPTRLVRPRGLSLDLDTSQDLAVFIRETGATHAHAYLRAAGLDLRLAAAPRPDSMVQDRWAG
jgi:2-phospho-L-lactate guanylyltransferase